MAINPTLRRKLKAQAHNLDPVIITGNKGITTNLILETDRALETHELIKVRVNAADKEQRKAMALELCQQCQAELIGSIGHIAILYRERKEEK